MFHLSQSFSLDKQTENTIVDFKHSVIAYFKQKLDMRHSDMDNVLQLFNCTCFLTVNVFLPIVYFVFICSVHL